MSGQKKTFVTPLTSVETSDLEGVGTIRFEGNKVYKYVKLLNVTATVAVVAGDVLAYSLGLFASHTVVSDKTDAATKPMGAGIALAACAAVAGTSYYLWVQIRGAATPVEDLAGSPTDGDALFAGGADTVLTLATAADDPICAFADDDSANTIICAFPF